MTTKNPKALSPYRDFKGKEIYEGDKIIHPSGQGGIVVLHRHRKYNCDKWCVYYGTGYESRLCLQVSDKGMAEVVGLYTIV